MTNNDITNQLALKGTTTIGVVGKDGVVLASDTRVTMGLYVAHKHGKKNLQDRRSFSNDYCWNSGRRAKSRRHNHR